MMTVIMKCENTIMNAPHLLLVRCADHIHTCHTSWFALAMILLNHTVTSVCHKDTIQDIKRGNRGPSSSSLYLWQTSCKYKQHNGNDTTGVSRHFSCTKMLRFYDSNIYILQGKLCLRILISKTWRAMEKKGSLCGFLQANDTVGLFQMFLGCISPAAFCIFICTKSPSSTLAPIFSLQKVHW